DYLKTLGKVATSSTPETEEIEQLNDFLEPYDPLVSYFVHVESAALHGRGTTVDATTQLRHWLHTVYYGPTHDRSVRNIWSAMRLLLDHPHAVASEVDRWSHLDGLLEVMEHRWNQRMSQRGQRLKYEPIDTEVSIQVIEDALSEMERLRTAAGVSEDDWSVRREVVEQTLLRPLRVHRARQARQYAASDVLGGRVPVDQIDLFTEFFEERDDRVFAMQDHPVVEFGIDPGPQFCLDVAEVDEHAAVINLVSFEDDDRTAVMAVEMAALPLVVEEAVSVAELDLL
ncbi:Spermidine synthase, partial [Durusdinium trenchii]